MRVHLGCEDDAFGCMGNGEDSEGIQGVFLRRNVVNVAGRALKVNLQRLGPLVLPITEMVRHPLASATYPLEAGVCPAYLHDHRLPDMKLGIVLLMENSVSCLCNNHMLIAGAAYVCSTSHLCGICDAAGQF